MRQPPKVDCHISPFVPLESERHHELASQAFSGLPSAIAELCMDAVRAGIAVESVRSLIRHHRLPAPATADGAWPWPFKVYVMGSFRVLKGDAPLRFSRRIQKRSLELLQALIAFANCSVNPAPSSWRAARSVSIETTFGWICGPSKRNCTRVMTAVPTRL